MLKLYRLDANVPEYWETWEVEETSHLIHWGQLGMKGQTKTVTASSAAEATKRVQTEAESMQSQGFSEIDEDEHFTLLVEYSVDGMGNELDIDKRHELEDRLNETLGWTGLGACDGGSIGSGTMEVCCFVVDFELAKRVIAEDLANTKFANYTRIYDENAE
jgi:predicted DNA-binding WGR domain protein